jgi:hypothetical protein
MVTTNVLVPRMQEYVKPKLMRSKSRHMKGRYAHTASD